MEEVTVALKFHWVQRAASVWLSVRTEVRCYKMFFHLEFHQLQVTSRRSWMTSLLIFLVGGKDAKDHYHNLQRLLDRLHVKGLRCKREECHFAQPQVEYLSHMLKKDGIHKGHQVHVVLNMPAPSDVTSLKSFSDSIQFYAKFQIIQPKLNLFIDLRRRMLNDTGDRTSNLLSKGSRVFCPVTRSLLTTTLLFQLGSSVTYLVLE